MANFTESATLILRDKSTAEINKINAALKRLFSTAQKMQRMKIGLDTSKLTQAQNKIKAVAKNISSLQRKRASIQINTSGISKAQSALSRLRSQASRPITQRISTTGRIGGGGGGLGGGGGGAAAGAAAGGVQRGVSVLNASFFRLATTAAKLNAVFAAGAAARATAIEGKEATLSAEGAALRIRQAGFSQTETNQLVEMSRRTQEKFPQVPAAEILDASVEMLATYKSANRSMQDMQGGMERIAKSATLMAITFNDAKRGAEEARNLEKLSTLAGLGADPNEAANFQEAAIRSIVAAGGDLTAADAVRAGRQLKQQNLLGMSADAIGDIIALRDEGGAAATAAVRKFLADLTRGSLVKKNKEKMAAMGLRGTDLAAKTELATQARASPVDFALKVLLPKLEKLGVNLDNVSDISQALEEKFGFTTGGAETPAQVIFQRENIKRDRENRRRINLDPNLADKTFRGSIQQLVSSFDTAVAGVTTKMAPAFARGIAPFTKSIGEAGKLAEAGEYTKAADTMANAAITMARGPAGLALGAIASAEAFKTLLEPASGPLEKAASLLVIAAVALTTAANKWLGSIAGEAPVTAEDIALQRQAESERAAQVNANYVADAFQQVQPVEPYKALIEWGKTSIASGKQLTEYQKQTLKEYQKSKDLKADAVIGPKTFAALEKDRLAAEEKSKADKAAALNKKAVDETKRKQAIADQAEADRQNKARGIVPGKEPEILKDPVSQVVDTIKAVYSSSDVQGFLNMMNQAAAGLSAFNTAVGQAGTATGDFIRSVVQSGAQFYDSIVAAFKPTGDAIKNAFQTMVDTIIGIGPTIVNAFQTMIDTVIGLGPTISNAFTTIVDSVTSIGTSIGTSVTNAFNTIITSITSVGTSIGTSVTNAFNTIINSVTGVGTSITSAFQNVVTSISGIGDSIRTAFQTIIDAVTGVGDSIRNAFQTIISAITNAASGISNALAYLKSWIPGMGGGETTKPVTVKPEESKTSITVPPQPEAAGAVQTMLDSLDKMEKEAQKGGRIEIPEDTITSRINAAFDTGASTIAAAGETFPAKGTQMGANFVGSINPASIGMAIGTAAAAQIRAATANIRVDVNSPSGGRVDTGAMGGVAAAGG